MIPTVYEFHWDIGHIVFFGIFYGVIALVAGTLGAALYHWFVDLRRKRASAIDWEEAFHSLPRDRRRCRHEITGAVPFRICENGFECGDCSMHPILSASEHSAGTCADGAPLGLRLPENRLYSRGHAWVEPQSDGTLKVGLDDLAGRCIGRPDRVILPPVGTELHKGDRGAIVERGRLRARVLSPVAGEVVELGDFTDRWLYRVRPTGRGARLDHLLKGPEARVWMLRELEMLQKNLRRPAEAATLADGGRLEEDLVGNYPDADWDRILGDLSLET